MERDRECFVEMGRSNEIVMRQTGGSTATEVLFRLHRNKVREQSQLGHRGEGKKETDALRIRILPPKLDANYRLLGREKEVHSGTRNSDHK